MIELKLKQEIDVGCGDGFEPQYDLSIELIGMEEKHFNHIKKHIVDELVEIVHHFNNDGDKHD